ncbi:hypothetical protein BJ138DRAFT_1165080 [Hygrophoropsis aurantiaca]|uniref:Uncharacterized protein n=1 Tax=Hygrophoropsis aurantiaca TaxID=72124 RepID=A0ACB7ZW15_9AGAM|nr:hypothetical protein BJ138DRAFT_1165080 [Hygrophoropsis aurantiaca]
MKPKVEKKEVKLSFPNESTKKPSSEERQKAVKAMTDIARAFAWSVHRWPMDKRIAEYNTKIHLPRTYLSRKGEDTRGVRKGADVNQIVHRHYMDLLDLEKHGDWVNYVHDDNVISRRHEYLGPDPRIAGYFFDDDGEIHIRWWDGFLKDQWMDNHKWTLNVEMNTSGQWVVKED